MDTKNDIFAEHLPTWFKAKGDRKKRGEITAHIVTNYGSQTSVLNLLECAKPSFQHFSKKVSTSFVEQEHELPFSSRWFRQIMDRSSQRGLPMQCGVWAYAIVILVFANPMTIPILRGSTTLFRKSVWTEQHIHLSTLERP